MGFLGGVSTPSSKRGLFGGTVKSDCGANATGGGGFQHGNTCAAGSGAGSESNHKSSGDGAISDGFGRRQSESDFDWLARLSENEKVPIPESVFSGDDDLEMAKSVSEYLHVRLSDTGDIAGEAKNITVRQSLQGNEANDNGIKEFIEKHRLNGVEDIAKVAGLGDGAVANVKYEDGHITITSKSDQYSNARRIWVNDNGIVLENYSIHVNESGKGLGTELLAREVSNAQKLGVSKITAMAVRAEDGNGYYTWPRMGFDGDIPWDEMKSTKEGSMAWQSAPDNVKSATRVSELMRNKSTSEWWKKHGVTMDVELDLSNKSDSMFAFRSYLRKKGML